MKVSSDGGLVTPSAQMCGDRGSIPTMKNRKYCVGNYNILKVFRQLFSRKALELLKGHNVTNMAFFF